MYGPHGEGILAHGYQGGLHMWLRDAADDQWQPHLCVSGHFAVRTGEKGQAAEVMARQAYYCGYTST